MDVSVRNLNLNYSYKSVLKNLSIDFSQGKIHGILGENGAGKSTLAKILCGELTPNSGSIFFDGKQIFPSANFSVKSAIKMGVCHVHQHPLLAENATIYENLILGLKKVDKKKIEALVKIWMPQYTPKTLVRNIGGDCNFFTALICALLKNPKVLILDEPCALLNDSQMDFLYLKLSELKKAGMNIIVITHSKKEAETFFDTVSFLEEGRVIENKGFSFSDKIETPGNQQEEKNHDEEKKCLEKLQLSFSDLSCNPVNKAAVSNISFFADGGEITLISGLVKDGLETLENAITGMEKSKFSGKLQIIKNFSQNEMQGNIGNKNQIDRQNQCCNANQFVRNIKKSNFNTNVLRNKTGFSVAIIPSNKTFRASNPNLSIKQMLSFSKIPAEKLIERAEINISKDEKVGCLSGGMLQRLILQRELSYNPEILIFCEPLQGLDIASSKKICETLVKLAAQGKIVLVLSASEFPKNICRRKYRLVSGRICPE